MADTTLTDLANQLKDIANQLMQLSQNIVKAHNDLGNQLQTSDTVAQQPLTEDTTTTKQGG